MGESDITAAEKELEAAKEEWGDQMNRMRSEFDFMKARSFNETRDASGVAAVKVVKEVRNISHCESDCDFDSVFCVCEGD